MIELGLTVPDITDDVLMSLSLANPAYRLERAPQGCFTVAPGGLFASSGEGELFAQVLAYAKSRRTGRAFPATGGFTLPDTSIVAPDATFVTNERLASLTASEVATAYVRLVPAVVFELLSPTDDLLDAERKIERYIAQGVRTALLITPTTVTIRNADGTALTHPATQVAIGPAMPGFILDIEASRGR